MSTFTDEQVDKLSNSLQKVASAILVSGGELVPGKDKSGGYVGSLTEAVMGVTSGLFKIAEAIELVAYEMQQRREADHEQENQRVNR